MNTHTHKCMPCACVCVRADGSSYQHAIRQLLDCPAITADFTPTSEGGREAGNRRPSDKWVSRVAQCGRPVRRGLRGGLTSVVCCLGLRVHTTTHRRTPPETKTSTFDLRVDYVLPSRCGPGSRRAVASLASASGGADAGPIASSRLRCHHHLAHIAGACRDLTVEGGAVFWPVKAQVPESTWVLASDHRPVFLDVRVCGGGDGPALASS